MSKSRKYGPFGHRIDEKVLRAFKTVGDYILEEQNNLRKIHPNNLLLKLVSVEQDGVYFDERFKTIMFEHTDCEPTDRLTRAIRKYLELLREEQTNPRFPQRSDY